MAPVLAAVTAFAALFVHSSGAGPRPQTVFSRPHATFAAFAQDDGYLAWFVPGKARCSTVHLLKLANGLAVDLPAQRTMNVTCRFVRSPAEHVGLALAGTRALWTLPQRSPLPLDYLLGASVGDPVERRFQEIAHTKRGVGQWLGGVAGRGSTLVYAVTTVDYADEAACLGGTGPCTLVRSGGGVYRVAGRTPVHVPGTSAAIFVAASGSAIAYVPAGRIEPGGRPRASAGVPIAVVAADTGQTIANVSPQGVPVAIALSERVLALLARTPLGLRLSWYRSTTGRSLGSVPVSRRTAALLTNTDRTIVYRVGLSLRAVDVRTHRVRTLGRAAAVPIGLSLDGSWLRWAENLRDSARIRALYVSDSG